MDQYGNPQQQSQYGNVNGQENYDYDYDPTNGGQRAPPSKMQIRPRVDADAEGEVDPTLYPQAKDKTHKIRGRSDVIEMCCGNAVDPELLFVKTFYFFFYAAFGSLFPLMGVYFKQMGMNPFQCGLLIGVRPFVEFLSAPFWGSYADRCKKGKMLLVASLACWILFTLPLGFIQPPPAGCVEGFNATTYELKNAHVPISRVHKRSVTDEMAGIGGGRQRRAAPPISDAGISPLDVSYANNFIPKLHKDWVSPIFSSIVYTTDDIQKAFFLLMLMIVIGEFFAAPAITLADSAVITLLGEDADKYGHQRMFGSLGWGLAMFFVGIVLDHSTAFPNHPCGPEQQEKNYSICFATFSVLMGAALLTATQIRFKYDFESEAGQEQQQLAAQQAAAAAAAQQVPNAEDEMQNQLAAQLQLPSLAVGGAGLSGPPPAALGAQTKVFAQTTRELPEWMTVIRQFKDLKCASFLFVAWFMGFGIGLIFTFLFWHLQDFGGSPTLFGVASVINHVSEIFAYFFSFRLITQIGHVKVLCLGLVGNILRFLYISWLTNPWYVLPFEFMQGITHAAVWAACCSYIAHNTPQQLRASAQGVLQGIHHGLGRGCGAVVGGIFVKYFGTTSTFRGYGEWMARGRE